VEGNDESDAINFLMPSPKSKILFLLKPKSCQISALRKLAINFFDAITKNSKLEFT
jgi:hypothetical protein